GVVVFDSLHPRSPHVALDENGDVVEVSETKLLSRTALSGICYFRSGLDFLLAAQQVIRKDHRVLGRFALSPALNELVLAGKRIACTSIHPEQFVPLQTEADFVKLTPPDRSKPPRSRVLQFRLPS